MRPLGAAVLAGAAAVLAVTRAAPPARARAPRRPVPAAVLVAGAGLCGLLLTGTLGALTAAVGTLTWRRWLQVRNQRTQHRDAVAAQADGIDLLVLAVRAGHLPSAAMRVVLPHLPAVLRPAYNAVVERLDAGQRFADAVTALADALGHPARPVVDALTAADHYGLPLGPVLDRLADEARHQRRRAAEAAARRLPVRLAGPLVLCTLPSFVLLAIAPLLVGALSSLSQ